MYMIVYMFAKPDQSGLHGPSQIPEALPACKVLQVLHARRAVSR